MLSKKSKTLQFKSSVAVWSESVYKRGLCVYRLLTQITGTANTKYSFIRHYSLTLRVYGPVKSDLKCLCRFVKNICYRPYYKILCRIYLDFSYRSEGNFGLYEIYRLVGLKIVDFQRKEILDTNKNIGNTRSVY